MMEQFRICAVWPTEYWIGSSMNHIQGLEDCLNMLLLCFRKRMSDSGRVLTAYLGCSRSGERARRSSGEPGSADFGLWALKAFLAELGVRLAPGLYV